MNELDSNAKRHRRWGGRRLVLAGAFLAVVTGIFWMMGDFDREPSYQGKSASYWLEQAKVNSFVGSWTPPLAEQQASWKAYEECCLAFHAMGKKAVLFLVNAMKQRPSDLALRVKEFAERHALYDRFKRFLPHTEVLKDRQTVAAHMIASLGPEAASAIPDLYEMMCDSGEDTERSDMAAFTLQSMGEAAVILLPDLCRNLNGTNSELQFQSVAILGSIGPKAATAVAALKTKTATQNELALRSAGALWQIARETNLVLGVTSNMLVGSNSELQEECLELLRSLGPAAKPAAPTVRSFLFHPYLSIRRTAEKALQEIDPELWKASLQLINQDIPATILKLVESVKTGDARSVNRALSILAVIGPRAKSAVPALIELLGRELRPPTNSSNSGDPRLYSEFEPARTWETVSSFESVVGEARPITIFNILQQSSALALAEIGPEARPAVAKLISLLDTTNKLFDFAYCQALGAIGPSARAAVPRLNDLLNAQIPQTRLAAAEALGKIAPDEASNAIAVLKEFRDGKNIPPPLTVITASETEMISRCFYLNEPACFSYRASVSLWRLGVQPESPVAELLGNSDTGMEIWKINLLGELGPGAKIAVPRLKIYLELDAPSRRAAAIAIRKIDPEEADRLDLPGTLALP